MCGVALALALGLTGCSGGGDEGAAEAEQTHVHALAPGPDGELLVGTHHGLLALDPEGNGPPERVGDARHDLMGLAADASGRLLASGHPDPDSGLPDHLGLVESTDGGRAWSEVSLPGEADFHALATSGKQVYGWDAIGERLLASEDGGERWRERQVPEPLLSLAADPRDSARVVGASPVMRYVSEDGGRRWRELGSGGGLLAWPADGRAVLVEYGSMRVLRSRDGVRWGLVGEVPFMDAVALTALDDRVLAVAGESGALAVSVDGGATWSPRASVDETRD